MVNRKDVAQAVLVALAFSLIFIVAIDISAYDLPWWGYGIGFIILLFIATAMMLQGWLRQVATTQGWSFVGTILGVISLTNSIYGSQPATQSCISCTSPNVVLLPFGPVLYAIVGLLLLFSALLLLFLGGKKLG